MKNTFCLSRCDSASRAQPWFAKGVRYISNLLFGLKDSILVKPPVLCNTFSSFSYTIKTWWEEGILSPSKDVSSPISSFLCSQYSHKSVKTSVL